MIPAGTVTFLFSDIEDSSTLWDRHPTLMEPSLHRHDELVRAAFDRWNGYVFATGGDGFGVAFRTATDAIEAAVAAQQAIVSEPWPDDAVIRVRMGLHTGTAEERDGDYFGATVSRAARVASAARATQIVVSGRNRGADRRWSVDVHRPGQSRVAGFPAAGIIVLGGRTGCGSGRVAAPQRS